MYVTTNSALVWKRMADENQQSARLMARISIGLFVLMAVTGVNAFMTHQRYSGLCSSVRSEALASTAPNAQKLARDLAAAYCD